MSIEPIQSESPTDQNVTIVSLSTQQNNWLREEIAHSAVVRPIERNGSRKSHRLSTDVIQTQPKADHPLTPIPEEYPPKNCPPGLEFLTTVDQLLVQQKGEIIGALMGRNTNKNQFNVKNAKGENVYFAAEVDDFCTRYCCGPCRRFKMNVFDVFHNEVMQLSRPTACDTCCFPCCLQSIKVSAPPGRHIGCVEQKWSMCHPHFIVKDAHGDAVLSIQGPVCTYSFCGKDVEFKVLAMDGTEVGKISKQWSGLARELFTDADFFGISFPMELDVHIKAVMMGACFLIDSIFFDGVGLSKNKRKKTKQLKRHL